MINASIITIGDELLIGQTIDTNSAYIAQKFNEIGIWVRRRLAVGDNREEIWNALAEEEKHSDIIILTGGLGPTADDITKPLLCEYFGGKLVVNEEVLAHVRYLFEKIYRRTGSILERNLKQAEVPDNCTVLRNDRGSAPGMWFEKVVNPKAINPVIFVSLPGVPHEMKGIVNAELIPRLLKRFSFPTIIHKTAVTMGQGESFIAELIEDFESSLPPQIRLAYLPSYGMVKLRLTAFSDNDPGIEKEMNAKFETLKSLVKEYLVTDEDEPIEKVIGELLRQKKKTAGTAESCTGGYIAHLLTSIAGSSDYFKGSVISYANEVKMNLLGVKEQTLITDGAVSEHTVRQMVKGAIDTLNVDYALATSGIMGPAGGTDTKPVGMVWIAVGNRQQVIAKEFNFRFDRERNIRQTANAALNMLRKFILAND